MSKPKVLVSRRWTAEVESQLEALYDVSLNETDTPLTAEQFKDALQNYDAVLTTVTDPITAEILSVENKRAKIIGQFGVGYNNIDIHAAKEQGLIVTNTPDVLTDCTADIAMLLLLMSARRASEGERLLRSGQWTGWKPTQLLGQKVSGKTLGFIGFGRIARAVAQRAHFGFGMEIMVYSRSRIAHTVLRTYQASQADTVETVLQSADFITLHCPGGEATKHLINEQRLRLMKPTAHLINTARGDVVDSVALVQALRENWIAGAGLDVYENEPHLHPDFLTLDNVSLLPHLGSASTETRRAMGERVLANINAFFNGKQPLDRVA